MDFELQCDDFSQENLLFAPDWNEVEYLFKDESRT